MPETLNQVCAIHFHSLIWRYSPPLQLFLLSMREMTKTDHSFLSGFYEISKRFVLGQRTNNRSKDSVTVSRIIEKFTTQPLRNSWMHLLKIYRWQFLAILCRNGSVYAHLIIHGVHGISAASYKYRHKMASCNYSSLLEKDLVTWDQTGKILKTLVALLLETVART